ncbi:MAG: hypothetical protein ABGX47_14900 [Martelella sp.]|uniref:hypothetical protein n=1 Tax=Martelella sp. TaxID=1969699 RepID=UPI003242D00C
MKMIAGCHHDTIGDFTRALLCDFPDFLQIRRTPGFFVIFDGDKHFLAVSKKQMRIHDCMPVLAGIIDIIDAGQLLLEIHGIGMGGKVLIFTEN